MKGWKKIRMKTTMPIITCLLPIRERWCVIQAPMPIAAVKRARPKSWRPRWMLRVEGREDKRMRIPPEGKRRMNAMEARTPWALDRKSVV